MKRQLLEDLKKVLETVPSINKVSHGKTQSIINEDSFDAVYINPDTSTFRQRVAGKYLKDTDDIFYVELAVNTDNTDDLLHYLDVEKDIIEHILEDSGLWTYMVDRNITTVAYDDYVNEPKKEFVIIVEFLVRNSC